MWERDVGESDVGEGNCRHTDTHALLVSIAGNERITVWSYNKHTYVT